MEKIYTIELHIEGLDERLIKCMKAIAREHDYDVYNHFSDNLVFASETFNDFTSMVNELARVCEMYNVEYVSLLV